MSRALLCLIVLALCGACQAPQPEPLAVRRQHEQEQGAKVQELLQRHDKLRSDLRAVQAERDHVIHAAADDYRDILDTCRENTMASGDCAARLLHYREKYRSVITKQTQHTIAALLTRYFYEEQRYDEAIHEGSTYLASGAMEDGLVPTVLLYTALSQYKRGQLKEGYTLLRALQEQYPFSQEAAIVRNVMSGSPVK